nr:FAD:protein FMN transferase [Bacillus kwashiorkori]
MNLAGCNQGQNKNTNENLLTNPYKRTEFMMGTIVNLKIYDKDKETVLDAAFKRMETLANSITVNEASSEVDKINDQAGKQPVKVSKDIFELIETGLDYSEKSAGSFDISIGPLTNLWRIGFPDARKPSQSEINDVLPLIDYKQVKMNKEEQTVFLNKENMQLDLGAIAKGFITDEVVELLKKNGVTTAIIDLGGNIFVMGKSPSSGEEWGVGIQDPFLSRGEVIGVIRESNKSIVTSGIYERYLKVDEETYHHLLNPEDGYPFNNDIAGVSVITKKSMDGDALSTAIFSKGIDGGLKFVETMDDVEAIFVSKDKKIYLTSGLKETFEVTNSEFEVVNY